MTVLQSLLGLIEPPPQDGYLSAFERAALRQRQSVRPDGGRQEGAITSLLDALGTSLYNAAARPSRIVNSYLDYVPGQSVQDRPDVVDAVAGTATDMIGLPGLMPGTALRGVLASGALRQARGASALEAQRMQQGRDMGFRFDLPLAHGTAGPEFKAFDLSRSGSISGDGPARMGVWSELYPSAGAGIANRFAETAAQKTRMNPRTIPLVHRAEKPVVLSLRGDEMNHEISATLADAFARGHDAVLLRNYTAHGGKSGDVVVVKDPSQLRSPHAKFDPKKRGQSDLMASNAPSKPFAVAAGAGLSDSDVEPLLLSLRGETEN